MKTKILIFTFLTLAISCNVIDAQQIIGLNIPDVAIHSPEVNGLGQYGDYLVDPSTGVVPVNIPLYTIKTARLEFPISLSYHASGIRVEEEATNVGLGWTLNASGVITRQIKDQPDEGPNGWLETGQSLPYYNAITQPNFGVGIGMTGYSDSLNGWFANGLDKVPDLFNVITPNLTGEFTCDNTGRFVSTIFDSVKYDIQLAANTLIVTDKMGVVYRFGMSLGYIPAWESSMSTPSTIAEYGSGSSSVGKESNPVSWYLTEIISADKTDTISFSYQVGNRAATRVVSQSQNVQTGGNVSQGNTNNFYTSIVGEVSTNLQIINRITFKNGSIQFYTATDRQDMLPDVVEGQLYDARITGFAVFDNEGNMIRKVGFDNNDYFNRTGSGQSVNSGVFSDSSYSKSLKLDGVEFYDKNGAFVYNYKFQYDNTPLPPRGSTALDYWGYYNGASNPNLIPSTWYNNYWTGQPTNLGGNRSTDINFMKAASLTQITYPTGGYTQFAYEPNYYLTTAQAGGETEEPRTISLLALQSAGGTSGCVIPVPLRNLPDTNSTQFTVTDVVENSIATLSIHFSDFEFWNNSEMTATITDLTNGAVYSFQQTTETMTQEVNINQTINFYQGHTYSIVISNNAVTGSVYGYCNCPFIELDISYTALVTQSPSTTITPTQAGGLRIQTITNFNADSNVISQKIYTYGDTAYGPNLVGAGTLISDPSNSYYNFPLLMPNSEEDLCDQSLFPFTWYTSNSLIDIGLNDGCAVVYSKVTEQTVSASDTSLSNGKTEYYYNAPQSYRNPLPGAKYPYTAYIYPDWGHNNLIKKIDYKLDSGNYSPVHEIDYAYQLQPENRIETLVVEEMQPEEYVGFCNSAPGSPPQMFLINSPDRFFYYNFYVSGGRIMKIGETETNYYSNGSLTSARTYNYNNYLDLSGVHTTDSRQRQIETSYKYTGDLNYSSLIAAHMVSLPTMQETTIDSLVRSGSILTYDSFGQVNSRYVFSRNSPTSPIAYSNYSATPSTYERRDSLTYEPSFNNLQEIYSDNSYNTAYLWDYLGQYPIAEVKNAVATDIAYTSFEADGTGGWTIGSGAVDTTMAITGNNSYNLSGTLTKTGLNTSTTYIISYWTTNNSAFSISGTISGYPVQGKTEIINNNSWTLYVHKVTGQSTVTVNGSGHIDELRLYPATAQMTTYTYAPLTGMTTQTDIGNRATYYAYDGFGRLKIIRDQDYNILKTFDYQYQTPAGCGSGCSILAMQTFIGTNTPGYPVGVFDMHGNLIGNATGASNYVSLWNSDTADSRIGTLAVGSDSLHFNLSVNSGQTAPARVTGCRYYQYDLPWNKLDGVTMNNGAYVNFGDGTGMPLPTVDSIGDTLATMPPNTTKVGFQNQFNGIWFFIHTYPNDSLKTITLYHNDVAVYTGLDNGTDPATSLTKVQNLRGNFPQSIQMIGGSCYQQSSALSVANISNWNSIGSVTAFWAHCGDHITPSLNLNYTQDFMANNRNLQTINTTNLYLYQSGYWDSTFKLSRLKSNWNTYFTNLQDVEICDAHWNRENLSALTRLSTFCLVPDNQNHSNDSTSNPSITIPASVIDAILNQIAAGAGQNVEDGVIWILTGGSGRTSASNAAVSTLDANGWLVYIDNIQQ
jgi:YD repeat-containing protein